ncbi:MAG: sulfatase [Candidatus Sumerlaeia bacterium]
MPHFNRRDFLKTSAAATAMSALGIPLYGQDKARLPNIVMIYSDQLNVFTTGIMGYDIKTPNIDRLAKEGTWFRNTVCAYPLCVPSRLSLGTGVYPHQRDYFGNNGGGRSDKVREKFAKLNEGYPLMWQRFAEAGYDCGYVGKWHIPVDYKDPEKSGLAFYGKGGMDKRTEELIERMNGHDGSQPFFMTFSYDTPHEICGWARNHAKGEHKEDSTPPPADQCPPLPPNHAVTEDFPEALKIEKERGAKIAYPTAEYDDEDWRQYRWAYKKYTEGLDERIGQIVGAVESSPFKDNTIIVFVADHGDGNASHHWNQKTALWEECIRVPWMIRVPGAPKGVVCDAPVCSGTDFMPTMLDLAGLEVPDKLFGQSLKPVIEGQEADLREYSVTETSVGRGQGRTIRTARYKYILYTNGEKGEQFFDLEKDPGEMHNRIDDAKMADEIARHKKLLAQWKEVTQDGYVKIPS